MIDVEPSHQEAWENQKANLHVFFIQVINLSLLGIIPAG
jgi:hypothetical protein